MKKHDDGIDFIIVSYIPKGIEYCKLLIKSIHKFFDDVSYTISIVVNYTDRDNDIKIHKEFFKDDPTINILEGVDQSSSQKVQADGAITHPGTEQYGKLDNNKCCLGSYYGAWGTNIGIKNGNRKYVCVLDADSIFLNKCSDELMELSEKYSFIGNRWDPGNQHDARNNVRELGVVKHMLGFSKRKFYDDILAEKYVERDIWSAEPWNVDYRDVSGNLTWYAQEKGLDFCVLDNSHWDKPAIRMRYRIEWADIERWNRSFLENILDFPYGEQVWIGDKPIFYHQTRGGLRVGDHLQNWIDTCEEYLENE